MLQKLIFLSIFLTFRLIIFGQTLQNNFNLGNYGALYHEDSLKLFFNCTGSIVCKDQALYYRVGKIDKTFPNFIGEINDYDLNNNLILSANIESGLFQGMATYHYPSGTVKATGAYQENLKIGRWKFFYSNGKVEKEVDFLDGIPQIFSYNTEDGLQKVVEGIGEFSNEFYPNSSCNPIRISGKLFNGFMTGEWKLSNLGNAVVGFETFNKGQFLRGKSTGGIYLPIETYTDFSRISLVSFIVNENIRMLEMPNSFCQRATIKSLLGYGKKSNSSKFGGLYDVFFPELQSKFKKQIPTEKDQWLIVALKINADSKLDNINVASSINDTSTELKVFNFIKEMNEWHAPIVNGISSANEFYFTVVIKFNDIIIPADYIVKKRVSIITK